MKVFEAIVGKDQPHLLRDVRDTLIRHGYAYRGYGVEGGGHLMVAYETLEELREKEAGR